MRITRAFTRIACVDSPPRMRTTPRPRCSWWRGGVAVTFLHGIEQRVAVVLLGQDDEGGDVRGPVVARGLEAELVAFLQGEVDIALGEPAGDVGGELVRLGIVAGTTRRPPADSVGWRILRLGRIPLAP